MKSLLENYMPLKVAAHFIGLGESTLRRKITQVARGEIPGGSVPPSIVYNGKHYFRRDDVEKWFRRQVENRTS